MMVAQEVPTASVMAVPHGPSGVGSARRRMRAELLASGVQDTVVDDAVLILSELLSNSCRHARPICVLERRVPYGTPPTTRHRTRYARRGASTDTAS